MQIRTEDEIDAFTAGICIPPILMNIGVGREERAMALKNMAVRYPVYRELSGWIEAELAPSASQDDKKSLENVSTKGGVSVAMVSALLGGASFLSSVERGIERCAELRSELCKNLAEGRMIPIWDVPVYVSRYSMIFCCCRALSGGRRSVAEQRQ